MPNYNNGKIYKLTDNTTKNIYYGSTCQLLKERISQHKKDYKGYLKGKRHYRKSYDIIKNNNYTIELVEEFKSNNKKELLERERYYIENNNCINEQIPNRTQKEWYKDNKKEYSKKCKEWYENNKERKKIKAQIRYERLKKEMFNCSCGEYISKYTYQYGNRSKHKNCKLYNAYNQ